MVMNHRVEIEKSCAPRNPLHEGHAPHGHIAARENAPGFKLKGSFTLQGTAETLLKRANYKRD